MRKPGKRKGRRSRGKARKEDTRRKILAGAMPLELMNRDADVQQEMLGRLSAFLTRPDDRALFGLPLTGE